MMIGDDNYAADYGPAAVADAHRRDEEERVRRRIAAAVAEERERCARIADEEAAYERQNTDVCDGEEVAARIARVIREVPK